MQHLKGKLRGEAERLVQHLNICASNYDTCWELLTHRYNNLQLLFTKQIQVFMGQPPVVKVTSYELKRLHDTSLETIHAIHNLGVNTATWDPILVHILTEKMDPDTYASYMEARKEPRELPSFDELISFLESKFTALEPVNRKNKSISTKQEQGTSRETTKQQLRSNKDYKSPLRTYHAFKNTSRTCPMCKSNHILIYCPEYQKLSPEEKMRTINQLNICKNCLYCHNAQKRNSNKTCKLCNKSHHTTLHELIATQHNVNKYTKSVSTISQPTATHVADNFDEILLATIELKVKSADGTYIQLRCLLDQGSQVNLITESAAQRLGLQRHKQDASISGIGITSSKCKGTYN
ncbi:uncharacterized protein LOC113225776 [Hyposmocoma kahamanoa]|uniref:uncharacterized protein LOC113225776 n=1 Tax=Hyposmocoma kahamanoa TaxID=1477025 RepID=UPI000E6D75CD|nr:uncharacterized protein LOC113225776 [Hyposmocoma kahamanoa]